ncbi:hypothetical protein DES53_101553 [Roseimicrobium gellanilyticum]|uniref:Uncharacterized protein n=1 Tax=Roseimicrobium gellanilyticum TaxID=748857 RepID=A0A366HVZ3_9BACT|nr:hypothetical protein [Roseimicrobium gellanilyticum]RBP47754.1 hypothetical protein DES53_101553 [Roseimicrobium gellanilyticum]
MEPTPENIAAFTHARWRVRFTSHLIALHEGMSEKNSKYWHEEHDQYLTRHLLAKEQLAAFPTDWDALYPS